LQFLIEARRDAVDDRTRYVNRLTGQLKTVFPQILAWFDRVDSVIVGDFLSKWPTLDEVQQARPRVVAQFLKAHRLSDARVLELQTAIGTAVAAIRDEAVLEAARLTIGRLVGQLAALRDAIAAYDTRIGDLTDQHPSRPIFASFPCAGEAMLPRLIAAFGTDRNRYTTAAEMQRYSGIAPVTETSGKQKWVHWRWACPKFLRQTFHEWAWFTTRTCTWARAFYDQQRERGKSHQAAVRSLAFKWLRILFRCWKDATPYDDARYSAALSRKRPAPVKILFKSTSGFSQITGLSA